MFIVVSYAALLIINRAVIRWIMLGLVEEFWKANFVHERTLYFLALIFSLEVEGNYFFNHKNCESIHCFFVVGLVFLMVHRVWRNLFFKKWAGILSQLFNKYIVKTAMKSYFDIWCFPDWNLNTRIKWVLSASGSRRWQCLTFSNCSMHALWTTILQAAHFLRRADFCKRKGWRVCMEVLCSQEEKS